jgi:hypothetical protein
VFIARCSPVFAQSYGLRVAALAGIPLAVRSSPEMGAL